jgi:hypothetical protein
MKKRPFLFLAIMLLFPSLSFSATYYVSAAGDDSGPGTQDSPWQTVYEVNNTNLAPGDQVLFQRGGVFPGILMVPTSGTAGNPITYGAYGSGNRPTIDATWQYAGVWVQGKGYLIFRDLEVRNATAQGFYFIDGNNNITIDNVRAGNNGLSGITVSDDGGYVTNSNFVIKNTVVEQNTAMGMALSSLANSLIQGNVATNNCQSLSCGDVCTWCGGIRITNTTSVGTVIENNETSYNTYGAGIWVDFNGQGETVRYNKTHHNVVGIYNEITSGSEIYGNVSYNNGAGIWVSGRQGEPPYNGPAIGNKIYNNTVYGSESWGILLQNDDGVPGNCHDNAIVNNISIGTTGGPNLRVGGAAELAYNVIDHNCFGAEAQNMFEIGWGQFQSTYGALDGWYGKSTNSVTANPLFVNPAGGDLSLQAGSPGIDAGLNLGTPYNMGLSAASVWPSGVVLTDRATAWDIGAYERTDVVSLQPPAN